MMVSVQRAPHMIATIRMVRHTANMIEWKTHKTGKTMQSKHSPAMLALASRRKPNHLGRLAPGLKGAHPELDDAPPAEAAQERVWER